MFERLARLPRAQHDAHQVVVQVVTDLPRHVEAGIAGFHDHVQQHQRDIGRVAQRGQRFLAAVGMQETQAAPTEANIAQRKFCNNVDIDIIVHDQHPPRRWRGSGCLAARLRFSGDSVVVVDHPVCVVIILIHA